MIFSYFGLKTHFREYILAPACLGVLLDHFRIIKTCFPCFFDEISWNFDRGTLLQLPQIAQNTFKNQWFAGAEQSWEHPHHASPFAITSRVDSNIPVWKSWPKPTPARQKTRFSGENQRPEKSGRGKKNIKISVFGLVRDLRVLGSPLYFVCGLRTRVLSIANVSAPSEQFYLLNLAYLA